MAEEANASTPSVRAGTPMSTVYAQRAAGYTHVRGGDHTQQRRESAHCYL